MHYLYLHGWLSGPTSKKGLLLKDLFHAKGHELVLLDLNGGHPSKLTYTSAIDVVLQYAAAHPDGKIRLIGCVRPRLSAPPAIWGLYGAEWDKR